MLIDGATYRYAQIGIIVVPPAALLLCFSLKRRFKLGLGLGILALIALGVATSVATVAFAAQALLASPEGNFRVAVVFHSTTYRFNNGTTAHLTAAGRNATIVINDTEKSLAVMPVAYGAGAYEAKPDQIVPPFAAATSPREIRYYGHAEHAPPNEIKARASLAHVYWLTDPP